MNRIVLLAIVVALASLSACSPSAPTPMPTAPPTPKVVAPTSALVPQSPTVTAVKPTPSPVPATQTPPTKSGTIKAIDPNPVGLRNVPYSMALDTLRQQGYTIKTSAFATVDLYSTALIKDDVDLAYYSDQTAWASIAKGAPIRTIMSFNGNPYLIAAKLDIKTCADLNNRTMGYGSNSTVNSVMLNQYLSKNCPGTKPQVILIPNSPARFAALLSGQIDSVLLETEDALQLDIQAPGRFHILRRFTDDFPLIEVGGYQVNTDFAGQHPEIVTDFVTALVQAHRKVQDKQVLLGAIAKYLNNDASAIAAVDTYLSQNAWDVNGGLTTERVQASLDFLIGANMLPADLNASQVADLSFLDAVLKSIGRK